MNNFQLDFKKPKVILNIGKPGSGKSYNCRFLLLKNSLENKIYEGGIVITSTKFNKDQYPFIPERYIYEYDKEFLENYIQNLKEKRQKDGVLPRTFLIFEDMMGLLSKHDPFIIHIHAIHRHLNLDIYHNVQHLNTGASTWLKEVVSYAFMFNTRSFNSLKSLYENFGQLFEHFKDFREHLINTTSQKYVAMLYIQGEDNIENNYLKYQCPQGLENLNVKLNY